MRYRLMMIDDYDSVIALWQRCEGVKLRDADSRAGIEKYLLRNPGLSFVAERENQIVATIMAGHDGKRGYVQHLAVDDASRRQGVASQLCAHCLEALKQEGILKSHIHVLQDNLLAKQFWSQQGWVSRNDIEVMSFINAESRNV